MISGVTVLRKVEDSQGNILALIEDLNNYVVVFCEYNFFKEMYSREEVFVTLFQDEAEEVFEGFFLHWANPNNTMKDWYDMMECY